jgi:hypothetical protein
MAGWKWIIPPLIGFCCLLFPLGDVSADNLSCLICHGALRGTYTIREGLRTTLHVDGKKFAASVHGDLECTVCHLNYQDNPHKNREEGVPEEILQTAQEIKQKSPVAPVALAACTQCHEEIYEAVKNSVHGRNIFVEKETDGAFCLDCHGDPHEIVSAGAKTAAALGMTSQVSYENIVSTCGRCHEKKSVSIKYGLSTKILDSYNESFHGKKYHLGGKNLPVCTTCHGAHAIRSHKDPKAMVYGANKIKLCAQCHPGANAKFVAAITHKPIGKDNPIPYYAEKGLIVLTFCVITGCALHIILEALSSILGALRIRRRSRDEVRTTKSNEPSTTK